MEWDEGRSVSSFAASGRKGRVGGAGGRVRTGGGLVADWCRPTTKKRPTALRPAFLTVMGQSMGGLIGRFALAYLDQVQGYEEGCVIFGWQDAVPVARSCKEALRRRLNVL